MSEFLTKQEIIDIFKSINSKSSAGPGAQANNNLAKRDENTLVWVKNDDFNEGIEDNKEKPFYKALVQSDNGSTCVLKLQPGEECFEAKFMKPFERSNEWIMDYSEMAHNGIADMIDIDELNHATVLYNLYRRYIKDDIYTYVGPTLLAVNPFKRMSFKYPDTLIKDF